MERISIVSDKDRLLKSLKKLETQFANGKVSKRQYSREKRVLEDKLSTILAADRIKRLQGKTVDETPLESEILKEKEDTVEKEELIKKYVTTPKKVPVEPKSSGMSKGKVALIVFLVAAFFVGTGYGVYVMSMPSNNSSVTMTVNDSAFPVINNTTNTTANKTITTNKTTKTTSTTKKNSSSTTGTTTKTGNSTG
ncbi:hypothetical protein Metbo_0301 [Methanobacterium lacus]|jgi:hypothetical protein|uniref:Uncharacterized protein n=1 Tax=Methanobacterium lacus (strain AL-21) TaxID=877455 RepID=F0T8L1_METLA|nr:hypothetical protein [Methanobacterium lacus]ADZ08553.1 hypothetical protein Metbo_0301 [Methanobacterium lacus]